MPNVTEEKVMPAIESIRLVRKVDESPDLSFLGEYSDKEGPNAVDREKAGDWSPREYRYFNPGQDYADVSARTRKKYILQDYARMEAFNRGDWCMVGIWAEAVVSYPIGGGSRRLQTLRSGGLWGIESDSGSYFAEVKREELADLKTHLQTFGVDVSDFDAKAAEAEHTEG